MNCKSNLLFLAALTLTTSSFAPSASAAPTSAISNVRVEAQNAYGSSNVANNAFNGGTFTDSTGQASVTVNLQGVPLVSSSAASPMPNGVGASGQATANMVYYFDVSAGPTGTQVPIDFTGSYSMSGTPSLVGGGLYKSSRIQLCSCQRQQCISRLRVRQLL